MANFREKVLLPLKNEVSKIDYETTKDNEGPRNKFKDHILDFDFVFDSDILPTDRNSKNIKKTFREFLQEMQSEKQYTPPIRVLFAGDDRDFHVFVHKYVEQVLGVEIDKGKNDDDDELFE